MRVTFVSNYLTHHQTPFCERMVRLIGENFTFISTIPMEEERTNMGWALGSGIAYEIRMYESAESDRRAKETIAQSDVILIGAVNASALDAVIKNGNGIVFRYGERLFKNGIWHAFTPGAVRYRLHYHRKLKPRQVFMLCASAYLPYDLDLLGVYKNRCFKWGYFPETIAYDTQSLFQKKQEKDVPTILWAGRMIDWKQPESAIRLADWLKQGGYKFQIKMIGSGSLEARLRQMIQERDLQDCVLMTGNQTPQEVRQHMEGADILLATSNFFEGWGAVVNEGMNAGCAVVASHAMGSVPFLIENGKNGVIYPSGNEQVLQLAVKQLLDDKSYRQRLGLAAYRTITEEWNAQNAAERLLELAQILRQDGSGMQNIPQSGPCSRAEVIKNSWMR